MAAIVTLPIAATLETLFMRFKCLKHPTIICGQPADTETTAATFIHHSGGVSSLFRCVFDGGGEAGFDISVVVSGYVSAMLQLRHRLTASAGSLRVAASTRDDDVSFHFTVGVIMSELADFTLRQYARFYA
eukprot:6179754-Pleurochrysis_carterae.AAC.1